MRIILPLTVTLLRKKKPNKVWILNLNSYRNTHFQILNNAKVAYKENLRCAFFEGDRRTPGMNLDDLIPPYHFTYTIYSGSNRKFDLANVLSIVQKFTDDALIELGIITDDSFKVIPEITYRFGGVDKGNPRVELLIG